MYWGCVHDYHVCFEFQFFTIWGQNMTTFIYTLLVLAHIWSPREVDDKDTSFMMWWKWCSYLWTMILWWNIIITSVFWCFLLPTTDFGSVGGHPFGTAKLCLDHIIPVTITTIDWFLNPIVFEKQQIWAQLPIIIFYACVNLTIVKTTGYIIYPGVTWDSFLSWSAAIFGFPVIIGLWYLLAWCTTKKTVKFLRKGE